MRFDYVLVGGGLQNALIALLLRALQPQATWVLIERGARLGGNHAWSFHRSDVPADCQAVLEPLIEKSWPGYQVCFPDWQRALALPYATFSSPSLDRVVRERLAAAPGCAILCNAEVTELSAQEVVLADGRRIAGSAVIAARGPDAFRESAPPGGCGYLKFLGLEVRLRRPAELREPILMDARVPQRDGFRFFYVLPLSPTQLLIEDNYYSDDAHFTPKDLAAEVLAYGRAQGWDIAEVLRQESGVLPLPWQKTPPPAAHGPLIAGYQGGWFHPATSYSLPIALRLARYIARTPAAALFGPGWQALVEEQRRQTSFCHTLNWLLFRASPARGRWRIMSGFYRHPEETLRRFYALELTAADRSRILRTGALFYLGALALPRRAETISWERHQP